ncbi:short chain dehydrogenase reductase [Stipitochalara longipes BDJ]|nr:short chain dehydrogenase reductase [Stipitochalara longipes BDJ]
MAPPNWQIVGAVVTILVTIIALALNWVLTEVFPWRMLRKQKNANLAPPTKSFKGKTILITGANGAFGSRAAKMIADLGVERLILADVRDCAGVKEQIEAETTATHKPDIQVWHVDMMSYPSCQEFAKKARALKSLDGVLLVAGILSFKRQESPEGWETSIQVNYLSSALLGLLLLPALKSSPSNPEAPVLTFVTTFGLYPASPFMGAPKNGSYLKHLSNNKELMQPNQYGISKGLLLYFTRELAARISKAKGIPVTVNSADPGAAWTPLTNPNRSMLVPRLIMAMSARDASSGAKVMVNAVCSSEESHGGILLDYDLWPYPPFMERQSGRKLQQRIWDETRDVLEAGAPDISNVYAILDGK